MLERSPLASTPVVTTASGYFSLSWLHWAGFHVSLLLPTLALCTCLPLSGVPFDNTQHSLHAFQLLKLRRQPVVCTFTCSLAPYLCLLSSSHGWFMSLFQSLRWPHDHPVRLRPCTNLCHGTCFIPFITFPYKIWFVIRSSLVYFPLDYKLHKERNQICFAHPCKQCRNLSQQLVQLLAHRGP